MQWENLTSTDFARAVQDTGVCILALGVLERHSEHLPLGTDMLNSHAVACLAAQAEPAVVFPQFYFGQIYEARCFPGTLTLRPTLLIELLQGVLAEIARNGFKKIILFNGHGGNNAMLRFLAQTSLWEEAPYSLYLFGGPGYPLTPSSASVGTQCWKPNSTGMPANAKPASPWQTIPSWSTWSACRPSRPIRSSDCRTCPETSAGSAGTPTFRLIMPGTPAPPALKRGVNCSRSKWKP